VLELEGPKIESSYFLGKMRRGEIEVVEIGTFIKTPISNGIFDVEGKDILTVKGNEKEMATVKTQSISKPFRNSSKVVYGSNFYYSSNTGKLSFLNNLVGVYEGLVDDNGNILYKVWEWKEPQ
jgi:hypothetical protein